MGFLGDFIKKAAPLAPLIPGVEPLLGAGLAVGGSLLGDIFGAGEGASAEEKRLRELAERVLNPNFGRAERIETARAGAPTQDVFQGLAASQGLGRGSQMALSSRLTPGIANKAATIAIQQGNQPLANMQMGAQLLGASGAMGDARRQRNEFATDLAFQSAGQGFAMSRLDEILAGLDLGGGEKAAAATSASSSGNARNSIRSILPVPGYIQPGFSPKPAYPGAPF